MQDHFEIVPVAGGGWASVADGLARLLDHLRRDGDQIAIVEGKSVGSGAYYVQFMLDGDGSVYGEAVGNEYIADPAARLGPQQHDDLLALGWRSPDDPAHPAQSRHRNYWHEWPTPAPVHEVATLAIATLSGVYGLSLYEALSVSVFPSVKQRGFA